MAQQLDHPRDVGKKTLHPAKNLPYPRLTSLGAVPRTQRHVPSSITTLRLRIAAALAQTLPRCPWCLRVNARFCFWHSKTSGGAAIRDETLLRLTALEEEAEVVLVDAAAW